jgi:hypothetical protein
MAPPSPTPVAADKAADAAPAESEAKPRPAVRLAVTKVTGALTKATVEPQLRRFMQAFGRCSAATGALTVTLTISADGKVTKVTFTPIGALARAPGLAATTSCLKARLMSLRFGAAAASTEVVLTLTL